MEAPGAFAAAGRPFTAEEDEVIVACYRAFPNRWSTMASFLPGRTANDVKNRCNTVLRGQLQSLPPRRRPVDGTLPLFPLVAGDVRGGGPAPLRRQQQTPPDEAAGDDVDRSGGACLALFPLAPGDLITSKINAREAAAMDIVDVGAGDVKPVREP